jgi:MerR family transcriptional regulator, thiopeptide resistance regulator
MSRSDERDGGGRRRPQPPYKVGELARLAGVSVRTLHHYEDVKLLVPSERTASGHRLYGGADVERLARVRALVQLGLQLDEIRRCLEDRRLDPLALVERHLERARQVLEEQAELCQRLEAVRAHLSAPGSDVESFFEMMEVMQMIEKYYTKEQLDQLAARREQLGDEGMQKAQQAWADVFARIRAEMDKGTDPKDPAVQAILVDADALIQQFTGGDPGIAASLNKMYSEQPVQKIHPSFDPEVFAYMARARQ